MTLYTGMFADRKNFVMVPWVKPKEWVKYDSKKNANSCQKPRCFYQDYLKSIADLGLVFDLFAGTATVSTVAMDLNINFLALEKNETQFQNLNRRLQTHGDCRISMME